MAKALWQYLRAERREPDELVFYAERGHKAKEALTRNGLGQLVRRLGAAAGVKAVRCSPHSLRHTYAVSFLRASGNVFPLREALGPYQLADNAEVCGDRGSGCRGAEQTLLVDGQAFVAELAVTQMKPS